MSWTALTMTYTAPPGSSREITTRPPDWGNTQNPTLNQTVLKTAGGVSYVSSSGPRGRSFTWSFLALKNSEKAAIENFFDEDGANGAMRAFDITFTPNWMEVLSCGCEIDGEVLSTSEDYHCGERVVMDEITLRVKLVQADLNWMENLEGTWDVDLVLEEVLFPRPNA